MLRQDISTSLKEAMKARDEIAKSTLRLIMAALKDREIANRTGGKTDGVGDDEILEMLQKMVRQRRESIDMYEKGGRKDLAAREAQEIEVIQGFLPKPMTETETQDAIAAAISELGAESIKDMGRVMGHLKQQFAGRMDFGKASGEVKKRLM